MSILVTTMNDNVNSNPLSKAAALRTPAEEAPIPRTDLMTKNRGARIDSKQRSRVHSTLRTSGFQLQERCSRMLRVDGRRGKKRPRLGESPTKEGRAKRYPHNDNRILRNVTTAR